MTHADITYRKVAWKLIPFLIICYISAFVDRSNIAVAKLQFTADLGMSEAAYGLGGGLFYLGYCLFEVPSNLWLQKVGARRTLMRIMILWSLCSASFAFVTEAWQFYALRFLLGAAEAGFFPGVLLYLTFWAPAARRARFTALFMSAMALAGVITGPISGAIMAGLDGVGGFQGWQWLFLVEGLPGVLLAVITYFYLADRPSEALWLSDDEKAMIHADLEADAAAKPAPAHGGSFWPVFADPRFYVLALMAAALISTIGGLALWLPTVIKRSGVTDIWMVGLLSATPYVAAVVVQQLVARSSDRSGERRFHAGIPALIGAAGWLLLPQVSESPVLSLVVLAITAAGTFGATGPFWTLPAAILSGRATAGGIAAVTTVGGISGFISPIIVGWAADKTGSLAAGQYYYGLFMLAGASLLLVGLRPAARAAPAQA